MIVILLTSEDWFLGESNIAVAGVDGGKSTFCELFNVKGSNCFSELRTHVSILESVELGFGGK